MKKFLLLLLMPCIVSPLCAEEVASPQKLKVLFIGNSYTVGLPETISRLAAAHGKTLTFKAVTKGGWTLKKHAESKETLAAIRSGDWDYVILQEQSQTPSFPEAQRTNKMYPFAVKLNEEIQKANAKTLFYLTWGRDKGDLQNVPDDTFKRMQARLDEGYKNAAQKCAASIVPAGTAWATSRAKDPSVNLYRKDGSHPNEKGRYLTACVFFRTLFGTDVRHGPRSPEQGVSSSDAKFLQGIANSLE